MLLKKISYVYPNNINFIWNCFFKFTLIFFFHYKTIYRTFKPNALALDPTTKDLVINSISLASFDDDICPTIIIFSFLTNIFWNPLLERAREEDLSDKEFFQTHFGGTKDAVRKWSVGRSKSYGKKALRDDIKTISRLTGLSPEEFLDPKEKDRWHRLQKVR